MGHNATMMRVSPRFWCLWLLSWAAVAAVQAQDAGKPVYRCPGPPVLYTDALTPAEASARQCRTLEGAPVTVMQVRPPAARPAASSLVIAPAVSTAARPADRVDPAAQRARDTDARRILSEELRREEERLTQLQKDYANGQPERRGDERNYQKYADRVAELKASIQRKEADITALKREIGKLPQ
jgi:hypothetical protein